MRLFCFGFGYSAEALARRLSARTSCARRHQDQPRRSRAAARRQAGRVPGRRRLGRGAQPAGRHHAPARQHPARHRGRHGAAPFPRRPGGPAGPRLGRLPVDGRRLRRLAGAVGRRDEPDAAHVRAQPAPRAGRAGLARLRRRDRPARRGLPPRRHLRAGAQRDRQPAGRHGAAHRQARPGVQPHPRRRHRRRAGRGHRHSPPATASTTSATTSRRRPRTSSPTPRSCWACPCRPRSRSRRPASSGMAASFWAESKRVSNARIKTALGVELAYPTYREGLRAIVAGG